MNTSIFIAYICALQADTETQELRQRRDSVKEMDDFAGMRLRDAKSIVSPSDLQQEIAATTHVRDIIATSRNEASNILRGTDPNNRLMVIVGPCSIHDTDAAEEYCSCLLELKERYREELFVVMRCYLEKPRTTVGWKGLVNDPDLDGTSDISKGLRVARKLCLNLARSGIPLAYELLNPISAQYLVDLISVGAIGARTTESQTHRELASGLPFPVGFKNSTDGSHGVAINAVGAAMESHHFLSISKDGNVANVATTGNMDGFIILRGGTSGPNYNAQSIKQAKEALARKSLPLRLVVDCSHGNCEKNYRKQIEVVRCLAEQLEGGEDSIMGVMVESNLNEGSQRLSDCGRHGLNRGISITDPCIGWNDTEMVLQMLAKAVRARRQQLSASPAETSL